jgi:hypothetical protein
MRAHLPDRDYFIDKSPPRRPDLTIIEWIDSGNDAHLFRAHSKTLGRDLACKVIPRRNLVHAPDGRELWRAEVEKANALRSSTVVKCEDIQEWKDDAAGIDCIVLVSEFVEGACLRKFMSDRPDVITVPLIVHWLETMLNLFNEMKIRGITHGDFHA